VGALVTAALAGRVERRWPGVWSLAALALSVAGVLVVMLVIATAERVEGFFWPLFVAPVVISLAPVLVPVRGMRVAAAVLLGLWCLLTGLTVGFLFLPAAVAQIGAAIRENA
jgi:FtsH-binding integral membrane protein